MSTPTKYIEGVGRRKEAVARVRLTPASKTTQTVNGLSFKDYFKVASLIQLDRKSVV